MDRFGSGPRRCLCAILACLGALAASQPERAQAKPTRGNAPAACAPASSEADTIEAVSAQGELRLASGRLAKLAGVRLPDGEAAEPALGWLRAHAGRPVAVAAGRPDRWGRTPAAVALTGRAVRLDLAQGLVENGLAVADAGEADALCAPELLAIESTARDRNLGVWAGNRYKPTPADDGAALRGLAGRFALVEGRIRSVGERSRRTYLNFGSEWAKDFTITIPKRTWTTMQTRGLSAQGLKGRRVRARGVVEVWRGPTMEIAVPDMLEILDQDGSR